MADNAAAAAGGPPPPPPPAAAANGDHNHNNNLPTGTAVAHWLDLAGRPPSRDVLHVLARSSSMTTTDDEALAYLRAVAQHLRAGAVPEVLQVRCFRDLIVGLLD